MEDTFKKNLTEQYSKLPDGLKSYVSSDSWKNTLKNIALKYALAPDAAEILNIEVMLVLFGLESYTKFEQNVESQKLSLPKEILVALVDEIYSSIFKEVEAFLEEVDKKEEESKPVMANGEVINKTQVLHDIENPQKVPPVFEHLPAGTAGGNIIDDKLNKVVKLPREEKYVNNRETRTGGYGGQDPYREPIQ